MQYELRDAFECRDGGLYWRVHRSSRLVGQRAGYVKSDGYRYVKFCGKKWQEHHLVALWSGGSIGDGECVHHIDGEKLNNDIGNLVVWDSDFHKGWHKAQTRNPLCVRFKRGGVYNAQYVASMSSPCGYRHKKDDPNWVYGGAI